ncbi:MAG: nucleotidyltransferase domain-containing protein [Myxococcaceae bacterium]|nr:nucleotidyltransferase domain-containing protein [Myxococcaceae bacterium]
MLTERQEQVMRSVLDHEGAKRTHVVVSLSGAHAYGFPSPDSDLDLKAVHLDATRALLGLKPANTTADRLEVIDGVEIDYTSNELGHVLAGILGGNGNYLERVLGQLQPVKSAWLAPLQRLVQANLSQRLHRHYRGFATSQLAEWQKSGFGSAKKLLYVLRTTLTGAHALKTGEVHTDVTALLGLYGFEAAVELVEQKKRGELAALPAEMAERWRERVTRAFTLLDEALATSTLPAEPRAEEALEAWLVEVRLAAV